MSIPRRIRVIVETMATRHGVEPDEIIQGGQITPKATRARNAAARACRAIPWPGFHARPTFRQIAKWLGCHEDTIAMACGGMAEEERGVLERLLAEACAPEPYRERLAA